MSANHEELFAAALDWLGIPKPSVLAATCSAWHVGEREAEAIATATQTPKEIAVVRDMSKFMAQSALPPIKRPPASKPQSALQV